MTQTGATSSYMISSPSEFRVWRSDARHTQQARNRVIAVANVLLILAVLSTLLCCFWEYSTERYVKGFADAIIPASASDEQKVESILRWMSHGPARENAGDELEPSVDRDPIYTLNYTELLKACGTATNAFLNLAASGGLKARRLLLLDANGRADHVVAEVWLDGRWTVVDPAFRLILRGPEGQPATRQELADPAVLAIATRGLRGYASDYNYRNTAHIRFARFGVAGSLSGALLRRSVPRAADSATLSLVLERRSLAVTVLCVLVSLVIATIRLALALLERCKQGSA